MVCVFPGCVDVLASDLRFNSALIMDDWMVYQGFTPIIIATKLDKIKRSQIQKNVKAIREGLKVKPGTVIIPFSSETKQGRDELWEVIDSFVLPQEETEEEDK